MKLFIVLIVAIACVYGEAAHYHKDGSENSPSNSRHNNQNQPGDYQETSTFQRNGVNKFDSEESSQELIPESLKELLQTSLGRQSKKEANQPQQSRFYPRGQPQPGQRRNQNRDEQNSSSSSDESEDSSLGNWASYPEAAPFNAKIKSRLASSQVLNNKPELRKKITDIVEEKFNQCKGKQSDMERACLARSTGQIMQLVAAVENMARTQQ